MASFESEPVVRQVAIHLSITLQKRNTNYNYLILIMPNPKVFFDMTIGGAPAGRVIFDLYADVVPKTGTSCHLAIID